MRLRTWIALLLVPCLVVDPALANCRFRTSYPSLENAASSAVRNPQSDIFQDQALAVPLESAHTAAGSVAYSTRVRAGDALRHYAAQTEAASVIAQELRSKFGWSPIGVAAIALWAFLLPAIAIYEAARILTAYRSHVKKEIYLNSPSEGVWFKRWPKTIYEILTGFPFKIHESSIGAWPVFSIPVRVIGLIANFVVVSTVVVHFLAMQFAEPLVTQETAYWHFYGIIFVLTMNITFIALGSFARRLRNRSPHHWAASSVLRQASWIGGVLYNFIFAFPLIAHNLGHVSTWLLTHYDISLGVWIFQDMPFWHSNLLYGLVLSSFLFLVLEIAAGIIQRRGSFYSLFFEYETSFSRLMSPREGQYQLKRAARDYVRGKPGETAPYVGLIRIDPPFDDIALGRMGEQLADVMRERIYSYLVKEVRLRFPGAMLAATVDPNEVLVILPSENEMKIAAKLWTDYAGKLQGIERRLYAQWLDEGYAVADMPQLAELQKTLSRGEWQRLIRQLKNAGLYWSPENGGVALILKMPQHVDINHVIDEINKASLNLGRTRIDLDPIDFDLAARKYPRHAITLSTFVSGIRKCDEMTPWIKDEETLQDITTRSGTGEARLRARQQLVVMDKVQRTDALLSNLECVLQAMRRRYEHDLSVIVVQRNPVSSRQIAVARGFIPMPERELADLEKFEAYVGTATDMREESLNLLDATMLGRAPTTLEREALRNERPQDRRTWANLRLEAHEAELALYEKAQADNWRRMREVHEAVMGNHSARTDMVNLSGHDAQQAEMFRHTLDPAVHPDTAIIEVIANPRPPQGMKTYGHADGSGMAMLGVMHNLYIRFVSGGNLSIRPEQPYSVYDVLGSRSCATYFGAGMSSRNPLTTALGKILGFFAAIRRPRVLGEIPQPLTNEGALRVIQSVDEYAIPKEVDGRPMAFWDILYGDNMIILDPDQLKKFYEADSIRADGLTLKVRRVPFEEAMSWGCVAVDTDNHVLRFEEKPGLAILKDENERAILTEYLKAMKRPQKDPHSAEVLAEALSVDGKQYSVEGVRRKLKRKLGDMGLIVGDNYILMNAGLGTAGTGAMIRFMQLSGFDVDIDGNFTIRRPREVPRRPGDYNQVLSKAQEALAALLLDESQYASVDSLKTALSDYSAERESPSVDVGGNDEYIKQTLDQLATFCDTEQDVTAIRKRIKEAILDFGSRLSVRHGFLRDGLEMDMSADVLKKMGKSAIAADEIPTKGRSIIAKALEKAQERLAKTPSGDKEARANVRSNIAILRLGRMVLRKAMGNGQFEEKDQRGIAMELEIAMARERPNLEDPGVAHYAEHLAVYQAMASVLWNLRMWQILRAPGTGGAIYAFDTGGLFYDSGAHNNILDYFLRRTRPGRAISAGFALVPYLYSVTPPMHALASVVEPPALVVEGRPADSFSPESGLIGSRLGGSHPVVRARVMEKSSVIHTADVPFGFTLYQGSEVAEGVVQGPSVQKKGQREHKSYVTYILYSELDAEPGKSNQHFGEHLLDYEEETKSENGSARKQTKPGWLKLQGVDASRVWDRGSPQTLFYAKLFPGVSMRLMDAARTGLPLPKLKEAAVDDLDWEIFCFMPEIWDWLQHRMNAPPPLSEPGKRTWFDVYQDALATGRTFSIFDHYDKRDPDGYLKRQAAIQQRVKTLVEAFHLHKPLPPPPPTSYWITGLDAREGALARSAGMNHIGRTHVQFNSLALVGYLLFIVGFALRGPSTLKDLFTQNLWQAGYSRSAHTPRAGTALRSSV